MGSQVLNSLVRTRARCRKSSSVFYSIHRPYTEFFSITMVATKHQLIMALSLLTLSLTLLTSVDGLCLNCESPHGEWCCNTPGMEFVANIHSGVVTTTKLTMHLQQSFHRVLLQGILKKKRRQKKLRKLSEDQF